MTEKKITTEAHGCIVCGRSYQMLVVRDMQGAFIGAKVMSVGGREVTGYERPFVACEHHTPESVEEAVKRLFREQAEDEEED